MGCGCKHTKQWLLGYAGAVCAAGKAGVAIRPLFDVPPGSGGGAATDDPPQMPELPCPQGCAQSECTEIWGDFAPIWGACITQACRDQVFAAYRAALLTCNPVE